MQIISIAPHVQTHRWSVYLNAPSFTCTTRIDALAVKVMECETVLGTIEKICIKLPGDFIKRRTKGFAEHLQQVMFMGTELDSALLWNDFGIHFDCFAVSVILRNIAAEGLFNLFPRHLDMSRCT